ncbi:MAG: 5-methyltetrahydropteroyltriglutamate--homocysteine methyltransferase [Burkholderia plantarii]|nr:MAG: 5-methyltetrahydropteroyltriglutamate--homocysteine methyltransferase [Burkholderia plantarii]
MSHTHRRILSTHVGSLIRPIEVMRLMKAKQDGDTLDPHHHASRLDEAVAEVVRRQAEVGIDIVSDGEFGRISFLSYIHERLTGFEWKPGSVSLLSSQGLAGGKLRPAFAEERIEFKSFYQRRDQLEHTLWVPEEFRQEKPPHAPSRLPVCTGPIRYKGQDSLREELARLRASVSAVDVAGAFVPAASPSLCVFGLRSNEHYASEEAYLYAFADALNVEYRQIIDAGFNIQIDAPDLTHLYDPANLDVYLSWLARQAEAINHALQGIPPERVRMHICWGSWNGPHTSDVPLKLIVQTLLGIRVGGYSIEGANDRHEHEVFIWDDVKLPEGKLLYPGVVGHVSNVVEHPELVAWQIRLYAERVGRENVIASTDCGFSQGWNLPCVHPQIQWAKLDALVQGARLASSQLW